MDIKVLEIGEFYNEKTGQYDKYKEFEDCPISYIVFDRSGNIGIVEEEMYTSSIKWINDDKRYKILYSKLEQIDS